MRRVSLVIGALGALTLASGIHANAAITAIGLFNTGETVVAPGADSNWSYKYVSTVLDPAPADATSTAQATLTGASTANVPNINAPEFPAPFWFANDSISKWVAPQVSYNPNLSDADGTYIWETTFNVDLATQDITSLSGEWWVDNSGLDVYLNGEEQFSTTPLGFMSRSQSGLFTFDPTQIVQGLNTVRFVTYNAPQSFGNPTGLRVEFSGTVAAIPEPAFYQMSALLLGGGLTVIRLRRKRNA